MRTRLSKAETERRVAETLALVRMEDYGGRYPRQLSGGQQQRVAMARALVSHPRLLLMDEPLGALDKKLRDQMQFEIKRIHRSVGTTFIYVTHDQSEALTMSDLVVLMHQGRIAQTGTPRELYSEPANVFVADFIGDSNLLNGRVTAVEDDTATVALDAGAAIAVPRRGNLSHAPGKRVAVMLRPEDIAVQTTPGAAMAASLSGTGRRDRLSGRQLPAERRGWWRGHQGQGAAASCARAAAWDRRSNCPGSGMRRALLSLDDRETA